MYCNPLFRYWWTAEEKGATEATFLSALFKRLASASGGRQGHKVSSVASLRYERSDGPLYSIDRGGFLVVVIANISPLLLACTVCLHAALGTSLFLSFTLA